jgi:hypothetical protein
MTAKDPRCATVDHGLRRMELIGIGIPGNTVHHGAVQDQTLRRSCACRRDNRWLMPCTGRCCQEAVLVRRLIDLRRELE